MRRSTGVLLIGISAISFGAMPIFARLAYAAGVEPVTLLFLRFTFATAIMAALLLARRQPLPRGRVLLGLAAMGAVGYLLQSLCYFTALTLASASLVALLLYLYPALVTVLSALLLRERITRARAGALLLALTGAVLTAGPAGDAHPGGVALAIGAAVAYAFYIVAGSQIVRGVPAVAASAVVMASAGAAYAALGAVRGLHLPASPAGWAAVLAIALISTVLAVATFLAGLERVGPTDAATISTLEPAVTVGLAALVLGEQVTVLRAAGGVMILSAVLVIARGGRGHVAQSTACPRTEGAG